VAALLALTTASCTSTAPGATPTTVSSPTPTASITAPKIWTSSDPAFDEIKTLLDERARAIADNDQAAFDATLDTSDQTFVDQQNTEFANLVKLQVTDISYQVVHTALTAADLKTNDPLLRPIVVEDVMIPGVSAQPIGNQVNFTFVQHDGQWLVAAEEFDNQPSSYAHPSQERPWAPGPIALARQGNLVVVIDESAASQAPGLAKAIAQGVAFVDGVVGLHTPLRLLVDATSNTGNGFEWSTATMDTAAITFPISTLDENGDRTGKNVLWAIALNPQYTQSLMKDTHVLHHELTHYVLHNYDFAPTWLVEGIAEYVGWQPHTISDLQLSTSAYDAVVKAAQTSSLPPSAIFYTFPDVNYPIAQGAVTYLVRTCGGVQGVLDLMQSYKGHAKVASGDAYTGTALQKVCGTTEKAVAAGALAEVRSMHHN
jgi:hypothetical protein